MWVRGVKKHARAKSRDDFWPPTSARPPLKKNDQISIFFGFWRWAGAEIGFMWVPLGVAKYEIATGAFWGEKSGGVGGGTFGRPKIRFGVVPSSLGRLGAVFGEGPKFP